MAAPPRAADGGAEGSWWNSSRLGDAIGGGGRLLAAALAVGVVGGLATLLRPAPPPAVTAVAPSATPLRPTSSPAALAAAPTATSAQPQATTEPPAAPSPGFLPPSYSADGLTSYPLTFLDGTRVVLGLPADLAARVTSFVPAAAACIDEACAVTRALEVVSGSVEALYGDREPVAIHRGANGEPVPRYADGDRAHLAFEFGDWVVRAWDGPGSATGSSDAEQAAFAASLSGHITHGGFLQLRTSSGTLTSVDAPDGLLTGDGVWLAVFLRTCGHPDPSPVPLGAIAGDPAWQTSRCAPEEGIELGVDSTLSYRELARIDVQTLEVGSAHAPSWATARVGDCASLPGPLEAEGIVVRSAGHGSGEVRGYDTRTGQLRWQTSLGTTAFVRAVLDGIVVVSPAYGSVSGLELGTGDERWRLPLGPDEAPSPAASAGSSTAVFGTSFPIEGDVRAPRVYAVDLATGEPRWSTNLVAGLDLQWSAPVVADGRVMLADTPSQPGSAATTHVHALDAGTGELLWRGDLQDDTQGFHCDPPRVHDGAVTVRSAAGDRTFDLVTGRPAS